MEYWFTVPEKDFEEPIDCEVDYEIMDDTEVFKVKSSHYQDLKNELERCNKMK